MDDKTLSILAKIITNVIRVVCCHLVYAYFSERLSFPKISFYEMIFVVLAIRYLILPTEEK